MKTYSKNTEDTLVTFHIGRGGRFNNQGHVSYVDQDCPITNYVDNLFVDFENSNDLYWEAKKRGYENVQRLLESAQESEGARNRFEKFGIKLGDLRYQDCNGNGVGLTVEEAEAGVGRIEEDGDYDTTYVQYLKDCSEGEFELILKAKNYVSSNVLAYIKEALNITEEDEA